MLIACAFIKLHDSRTETAKGRVHGPPAGRVSLKKSFNLSQNLSLELLLFGIAAIVLNAWGY